MQSQEKKRIVARDGESFSKYEKRTKPCAEADITSDTARSYQSPADIATSIDLSINSKSSTSHSSGTSPRTSPRAPANSYQFQKDWKSVRDDLDKAYEYLKARFSN